MGIQLTAWEWHPDVSSSNIRRIPPLPSHVPHLCPHLRTLGWPRKFHGSSICCRWGSLFSYWWVSRSAGLCGFQQAPQRLPDGPSQDGAYCGRVSMGALQMEPPGVIRLLRRGVRGGGWEVLRGIGATGGGGRSYLWGRSVSLDSHGTIFSSLLFLHHVYYCE